MDNIFGNISVVLQEERDMNMIRFFRIGHLRDKNISIVIWVGRDLEMAQAKSKEKEKLIFEIKGKENAFPMSTSWATQNERSIPKNQLQEEQETAMELEVDARAHVNSSPLNLTHEETLRSEEEEDMFVELEVDARVRINSCRHVQYMEAHW
ncbi:hypothetical protein RHSIM_Rhsim08G0169100 [Rhododendron simsii]|uniref:Uncharacterized protein n=1 Tax=Rhododendron simsii TaxID=118357 RepID=A0A834GK63_RHOSS|nr:hypothetical protein RHSIM_Rhsim08G0169100 [Rhododendron simsii]